MNIQEKLAAILFDNKSSELNREELKAYEKGIEDTLNKIDLANIVKALTKTCEYHEKNASWDKGDNGYYLVKKVLRQIESI